MPLENVSDAIVRSSAGRISLDVSIPYERNTLNNKDASKDSSSNRTLSENQRESVGEDDGDEETTPKKTRPTIKRKVGGMSQAKYHPIDKIKCITRESDLDWLRKI